MRSLHRSGVPCLSVVGRDDIAGWSRCSDSGRLIDLEDCQPETLSSWLAAQTIDDLVLMPCSDVWADAVARIDVSALPNVRSWVPSADIVRALVDKSVFRQKLQELDLPQPRTYALDGPEDLADVPEAVFRRAFLKPHESAHFLAEFGVKGKFVKDREVARRQLEEIHAKGFGVVLQEYVPGPPTNHYFIDGYRSMRSSETRLLARRRLRMYPLELGNSTEMVTVALDDVRPAVETIETLLEAIGYHGIFSAEFKLDARDQQFRILEVNCRPWWYVHFADVCGLQVCKYAYQESIGVPMDSFRSYRVGKRAVYPIVDWWARKSDNDPRSRSLFTAMRSWIGSYQPILCWRDPMPVIFNFWRLIERVVRKRVQFNAPIPGK